LATVRTAVDRFITTAGFRYQKFIWPSFVIWGLDRLIRLLRLLAFKLFSPSRNPATTLEAELISPGIVRLTIPRPRHFHWSPGQNALITIPEMSRLLPEAHPFTIATVDQEETVSQPQPTRNEKGKYTGNGASDSDLVFFIKVCSGFTKRLANKISFSDAMNKLNIFVDGPYGSPSNLQLFDTCVLLAGEHPCLC